MSEILIFAGTTEGRKLIARLAAGVGERKPDVYVCVATAYGKDLLMEYSDRVKLVTGRLDATGMVQLMAAHQFEWVIDTTHPYAREASRNIKSACMQSGCRYIRLLRAAGAGKQAANDSVSEEALTASKCIFFENHEAAAAYLNHTTGNVLLTIGSRELAAYTGIYNYEQRLFARVLPMIEILQHCFDLGFSGRQLLCMQGPFSLEFNVALINQTGVRYMVTKDSGEEGGYREKFEAARLTGITLLVIGRCLEEEGVSLEQVIALLEEVYGIT
jgi:precorrin-6x reductase